MAAVEVDEALLVVALPAVVELLSEPLLDLGDELGGVQRTERLAQEHADQIGVLQVGSDRLGDARVLHLDSHRPFHPGVRVVEHGSMDLTDRRGGDRFGVPLEEQLLGRPTELGGDDLGGEFGAHRRGIGLQLGEGEAHGLGQPVVEVAGHLTNLHQGALHVAEALGDLLGGAQLSLGVDLHAPRCRREQLACRRRRVRRSDVESDAGELRVAAGSRDPRDGMIDSTPPEAFRADGDRNQRRDGQRSGDAASHAARATTESIAATSVAGNCGTDATAS